MTMTVVELTKELIKRQSITPHDRGCQTLLAELLESSGFKTKSLQFDDTDNLLAMHGTGHPFLIFAGHTDVVPPGPLNEWATDPFTPTEKNGVLYGRGAADMKAAVAAMTLSATTFVNQHPNHPGTVAFVITSDEEGPGINGTIKVVEYLKQHDLIPDYVVVGEASSNHLTGDALKIGRRGSLHGEITIQGKQGHIAYPEKAENPIHRCFTALQELACTTWDQGNAHYPPSSLQFYDLHAGVGASNIIPGNLTAKFNIRFAPIHSSQAIENQIRQILTNARLDFSLTCHVSSQPYYSGNCKLAMLCKKAIKEVCNIHTELNTTGGTSDGRHFAPLGAEVVELGTVNQSIHKVNEHINLGELIQLEKIYSAVLAKVFL